MEFTNNLLGIIVSILALIGGYITYRIVSKNKSIGGDKINIGNKNKINNSFNKEIK